MCFKLMFKIILNVKDMCKAEVEVKSEEEILADAKNGDTSLLSRNMAEEEEKLFEARIKEEQGKEPEEAPHLNDTQFTKLDELLTQTQMYSEFLLEKMDDITVVSPRALFSLEYLWLGESFFHFLTELLCFLHG